MKGTRGQISIINHDIDVSFQEKFQSHKDIKSTKKYSEVEMIYKPPYDISSDTKCRESFCRAELDICYAAEANFVVSEKLYSEGKYTQQILPNQRDEKDLHTYHVGQRRSWYDNFNIAFLDRRNQYVSDTPNKSLEYVYKSQRSLKDVQSESLSICNKGNFKTYKESAENQHLTMAVKSKSPISTPFSTLNYGKLEEDLIINNPLQKNFKAQSRKKVLETSVSVGMHQNSIKDTRKRDENASYWEQQLNNSNSFESTSKEFHHHSTNHQPFLVPTETENLHALRPGTDIHNTRPNIDNTINNAKLSYMKETHIPYKSYNVNNGDRSVYNIHDNQGPVSELQQKTLFVQEQVSKLLNGHKHSKQESITSLDTTNLNSCTNKSQTNAPLETEFQSRRNNYNNNKVKDIPESAFYDDIITTLKISQDKLNRNGKLEYTSLASFSKSLLQGCSQGIRREHLTSLAHHPQSSVIPLLITNNRKVGAFTTEMTTTAAKEKTLSTAAVLETKSKTVDVSFEKSNLNSNPVLRSKYLNSQNKFARESPNVQLDDWAFKSQLFPDQTRDDNAKASTYDTAQENCITTQKQISMESRKYENNGGLEKVIQPSLKSNLYMSQKTHLSLQKALSVESTVSPTIKTESSHRMLEPTTYDHLNIDKGLPRQSQLKANVTHHKSYFNRRKGYSFKNVHFYRPNIKNSNTTNEKSTFKNALPIFQTSLESLWHDQKIKRTVEKMRAIRRNKTK